MRLFFDNCTSPTLAATLNGYLTGTGHTAQHIGDLPCGRHADDLVWIEMLRKEEASRWIIVTGDARLLKNKPERAALRQAGLCGFVLAPAYQKTPVHQQASFLLWRWPEIEKLTSLVAGPALYELPMSRSGKMRALPL